MVARELINFGTPPTEGRQPSFLATEALFGLTLAPPVICMLTAELGGTPSFANATRCMLATWLCTVGVGAELHFAVSWSGPRLLAAVKPMPLAIAALAALGAVIVVAGMLAAEPFLTWVSPHEFKLLVLRALAIGALYVAVARTAAVLLGRARASSAGATRARLAALQAQVSPHFLFNTLNAIASLIPSEPDRAEATLERLASVLQYSISSGSVPTVSLGDELATVRDYLGIQQARFGTRLRSRIEVSDELQSQTLPPMLLQPLVENAVLHGLASRAEGGEIWIHGHTEANDLVLTVADDGVGPDQSRHQGNKTGLRSVRERLALTYGAAAALAVRPRVGGGFECELRVPRG